MAGWRVPLALPVASGMPPLQRAGDASDGCGDRRRQMERDSRLHSDYALSRLTVRMSAATTMTSSEQTWFLVSVILLIACAAIYTRGRSQEERREMLDSCFRDEPSLAAKFYSARTPREDRRAIVEGCLGPDRGDE